MGQDHHAFISSDLAAKRRLAGPIRFQGANGHMIVLQSPRAWEWDGRREAPPTFLGPVAEADLLQGQLARQAISHRRHGDVLVVLVKTTLLKSASARPELSNARRMPIAVTPGGTVKLPAKAVQSFTSGTVARGNLVDA
jgi:hypothetical protein